MKRLVKWLVLPVVLAAALVLGSSQSAQAGPWGISIGFGHGGCYGGHYGWYGGHHGHWYGGHHGHWYGGHHGWYGGHHGYYGGHHGHWYHH